MIWPSWEEWLSKLTQVYKTMEKSFRKLENKFWEWLIDIQTLIIDWSIKYTDTKIMGIE